jgi:hypothetical protein
VCCCVACRCLLLAQQLRGGQAGRHMHHPTTQQLCQQLQHTALVHPATSGGPRLCCADTHTHTHTSCSRCARRATRASMRRSQTELADAWDQATTPTGACARARACVCVLEPPLAAESTRRPHPPVADAAADTHTHHPPGPWWCNRSLVEQVELSAVQRQERLESELHGHKTNLIKVGGCQCLWVSLFREWMHGVAVSVWMYAQGSCGWAVVPPPKKPPGVRPPCRIAPRVCPCVCACVHRSLCGRATTCWATFSTAEETCRCVCV